MTEPAEIDYGAIRDDYAFFLSHSTESAAQITALGPHMAWLARRPGLVSLLDFGCGTGAFTERLLQAAEIRPHRLSIALVEPVAAHLDEAAARLAPLAARVVRGLPDAPGPAAGRFDIILANHSLYYVPDLDVSLGRLLGALAPDGRLIAALLERGNALARIWEDGFALAGLPFPFHLAEDVEAALRARGISVTHEEIGYRIAFRDGAAPRRRVLRFLFGPHLARLPLPAALALFDPHLRKGRVVIESAYPHLVAQGPGGRSG